MNKSIIQSVVEEYQQGASTVDLATKWGVHPTTILRWIKKEIDIKPKMAKPSNMDGVTKRELKKLLASLDIKDVDLVLDKLDSNFELRFKDTKDEDFEVIILK